MWWFHSFFHANLRLVSPLYEEPIVHLHMNTQEARSELFEAPRIVWNVT